MSMNLAEKVYKDGVDKGYAVTSVKSYFDSNKKEQIFTQMLTPYVDGEGNMVTGCAVTPSGYTSTIRKSNAVEFYVGEHNMDYADGAELFTKDGQRVDMEEARKEMGQFAGAASEYPHVMIFDEWQEAMQIRCNRFKMDMPNPSEYETAYLAKVEREMMSGDVKYVGRITSSNDLHMNMANNPEYQASAFVQDGLQMDGPEFG